MQKCKTRETKEIRADVQVTKGRLDQARAEAPMPCSMHASFGSASRRHQRRPNDTN